MSLSTPRFDTVRLQVLRRLAVERGGASGGARSVPRDALSSPSPLRNAHRYFAKSLGTLGIDIVDARERLQTWPLTQRLDQDSLLELMLDLVIGTPVAQLEEEGQFEMPTSPRFDWPVMEMAQYEMGLERSEFDSSFSRIDVNNVIVCRFNPVKNAGSLRAFVLNALRRTNIGEAVSCTLPKDSTTGALKGVMFLALPSAEDASKALNLLTRRVLWPSLSPSMTVQTLIDTLEEQTPHDSFCSWQGRFFRQFQSQHSSSPPKQKSAPRKRKSAARAARALSRIEKQILHNLADRSFLLMPQWKAAEEALLSALASNNSSSLLEAVRLAIENHVALLKTLARAAGDEYEEDKTENLVPLEQVHQIMADLIGGSTAEVQQIFAVTSSILSLSLVGLVVEQSECKREAEERLMMASSQVSEHLQELSLMDAKCTELEEEVRLLDRQLKSSEERHTKALTTQSLLRLSTIDKAQRTMGELMQMNDGELSAMLTDLESHVSKVRTARDQVLARQHSENSLCCVCRDREKTILMLPCRHLCACAFCSASLGACPVCRSTIREKIGVFSS